MDNKIILIICIALAVALMSMLFNLMLVWKISDLKGKLDFVELTLNDRTSTLHKDDVEISNQLNKLECDTKDAFDIVTNNVSLHGTLIEELTTKFALLDGRVSKHKEQLEDLGKFAGITTGELRVLEQKIYNQCKPKELPEPEPIRQQIEDASLRNKVTTNNIEINSLGTRLSILENRIKQNLTENGLVTRVGKIEHRVAGLYEDLDKVKADIVYHTLALNSKINHVVGGEDVLPDEMKIKKPDRKRKDNYYRRPNKQQVIYDEFAEDIMKK